MSAIEISLLRSSPDILGMLSELLIETVAGGGSVSFMHPLRPDSADGFWNSALAAAGRDERIILGAWDGDLLAGTVTLLLDCAPNQPHRAEIVKMMTRSTHRGRGIATALMQRAEELAVQRKPNAAGAGHRDRRWRRRTVRETGIHAGRRDSGLCVQAAWRAERDLDLLEADRSLSRRSPVWSAAQYGIFIPG